MQRARLLFVCSRNQWRSPTAEHVFRNDSRFEVRSAGTSRNARRPVTAIDIQWATIILVMEPKHRSRLLAEFGRLLEHKQMHVLDIPDDYHYMDPELIALVQQSVEQIVSSVQ